MLEKLWLKIKSFLFYIKSECRDWRTFVLLLIVMAIVYSPVWGCYLIFALTGAKWAFAAASAVLAFWAGPFTPFFPLCIAITLGLKKLFSRNKKKPQVPEEQNQLPENSESEN